SSPSGSRISSASSISCCERPSDVRTQVIGRAAVCAYADSRCRRRVMDPDARDKIDELTNDLDEMKTTVEELAEDPKASVDPQTLERLKKALEEARDAADDLENEQER